MLAFGDGDGEVEGGALPIGALEPYAATLHFNEALGDVQTQAGAGGFTGFLVFRAEELLEDPSLILGADADAIVLDPDVNDVPGPLGVPAIGR